MSFKQTQTGIRNPEKQIRFAIASACTKGAQAVQAANKKALRSAFTIRTNWDERGPYAVKVQAAKKDTNPIVALVGTGADWLDKFLRAESGIVVNLPHGKYLAVPTSVVKRTKRSLIQRSQRPAALRGKRDVLLPLKSGKGFVLLQDVGVKRARSLVPNTRYPHSGLVALYILTPVAKIKQTDVLFGPAEKTLNAQLLGFYQQAVAQAIATAK